MKPAAQAVSSFSLSVSWVDLVVLIVLFVGLWRGRKRGMSSEFLDICQWAIIVVAAGLLYEPGGRYLVSSAPTFSLYSAYLFAYILIALVVYGLFALLRDRVGPRIVGSDLFGSAEYYLGMMAGVFRYSCIVIVAMAFLNARYYSPEEKAASLKYQEDNFGSHFFVTVPDLQQEVFTRSLIGRLAHDHLQVALIRPTSPSGKTPPAPGARRR